jgi:hypothetical protein
MQTYEVYNRNKLLYDTSSGDRRSKLACNKTHLWDLINEKKCNYTWFHRFGRMQCG